MIAAERFVASGILAEFVSQTETADYFRSRSVTEVTSPQRKAAKTQRDFRICSLVCNCTLRCWHGETDKLLAQPAAPLFRAETEWNPDRPQRTRNNKATVSGAK